MRLIGPAAPVAGVRIRSLVAAFAVAALGSALLTPFVAAKSTTPFLNMLPIQSQIGTTVPGNGDVNPYGVAIVPRTTGSLVKGDVLISNFNNSKNLQGTGTTIDEIAPDGTLKVFATIMNSDVMGRCPGGVGLSTALVALRNGWVVVGSLPTTDGMSDTAMAGCLIVLNSSGKVVTTIHGGLVNGPWDMTAMDTANGAVLFVSNVLSGTVAAGGKTVNRGTVVRINLKASHSGMPMVTSERLIGWGFPEKSDPAALVIGPTGLALAGNGTLYVADTLANRIAAIPNAVHRTSASHRGMTVSMNGSLNQPLGLTLAPNGDILTVNAGDGNIVETGRGGMQFVTRLIDPAGGGALFGLAVAPGGMGLYFVEDDSNMLGLLH